MAEGIDRIDELLADQEAAFREAFRQFLVGMGSATVTAAIIERLEARDMQGALEIIDSYVNRLANVIPKISATVGGFTADELAEIVQEAAPETTAGVSFDPSHPKAAEIVRAQRLEFVQNFTEQQRRSTAQALARSFNSGTGTIEAARSFQQSIGLTAQQEQWVASYRSLLETNSREALSRDLRARTFDGKIKAAIDRNRPLTQKQIDTMVDRYRRNALAMRAETIARTESTQAAAEARELALDQMLEQTGIEEVRIMETWNANSGSRTRHHHATMNGQKQPKGTPFVDGLGQKVRYPCDPKAPANTRINCRCSKTFAIIPEA